MSERLVVVGGGVLGTMHALAGIEHGYEVVQIERDLAPRGASVRNFGLIWVGGRASGAELDLALRARAHWDELASRISSISLRAAGSLTVARTEAELAVLEEATHLHDAKDRGFSLLSPDQAREKNPALNGPLLGALWCATDAIVEPRLVLGNIRDYLSSFSQYHFVKGRHIVSAEEGAVIDHLGEIHRGDLVVCCMGANPGGFLADDLASAPLRRVRLQMLETTPIAQVIPTALADGDSLRYYPAYRSKTLDALPPQSEIPASWRAQLLLVQRRNGCLTIGDTHRYDEPFDFDVSDEPYEHLIGVANGLLGMDLSVERRWAGVYAEVTDPNLLYLREEIRPGVFVVTGAGGRGMTMSPAIALESFA